MTTLPENTIALEPVRELNRVPLWVMPLITFGVIAVDAAIAALCFIAAFKARHGFPVLSDSAWAWSEQFVPYVGILFFVVPIRLMMLAYQRVYRFSGAFSYTQEAIRIFNATLVSSLLAVSWAFLFRGGLSFREFSYSRGVFVFDFVFSLVAYLLFHSLLRYSQTRFREIGINLIPTLVVGSNSEVKVTVRELTERRYLGYRVIGVVRSNGE